MFKKLFSKGNGKIEASALSVDEVAEKAMNGLVWHGHSSFRFIGEEANVCFDPYHVGEDTETADYIVVSHAHFDHASPEDIRKIAGQETTIIGNSSVRRELSGQLSVDNYVTVDKGEKEAGSVIVEAFPAYNLNCPQHPKGEGNAFLVKVGEIALFHAGDSDFVKEMKGLRDRVDIAFLPICGDVVMDMEQAYDAVQAINPKVAVPMHYGSDFRFNGGGGFKLGDASYGDRFKEMVEGSLATRVVMPENRRNFQTYTAPDM